MLTWRMESLQDLMRSAEAIALPRPRSVENWSRERRELAKGDENRTSPFVEPDDRRIWELETVEEKSKDDVDMEDGNGDHPHQRTTAGSELLPGASMTRATVAFGVARESWGCYGAEIRDP
ncbi:hypothetical protein ZIOFF_034320 [Zingiber officinale]|uniref:Uncharacterized protein n=1 Tax=Zingiber officinale TaxID=94328 RepID=A0A8J5GRU9_ZINOF|nr:hypothetical protein ZIOFF_034320 [Zingiber officinale]